MKPARLILTPENKTVLIRIVDAQTLKTLYRRRLKSDSTVLRRLFVIAKRRKRWCNERGYALSDDLTKPDGVSRVKWNEITLDAWSKYTVLSQGEVIMAKKQPRKVAKKSDSKKGKKEKTAKKKSFRAKGLKIKKKGKAKKGKAKKGKGGYGQDVQSMMGRKSGLRIMAYATKILMANRKTKHDDDTLQAMLQKEFPKKTNVQAVARYRYYTNRNQYGCGDGSNESVIGTKKELVQYVD